jgi:1-pyrroline-5-carboxylate dehydrogenase
MTGFRVTYATLSADDDELHAAYDAALADAKAAFGQHHPLRIGSERRDGAAGFETVSPVDRTVAIGQFAAATAGDVADAVAAAEAAQPTWAATPWQERVAILDRAADLISRGTRSC